jgi:hypothetical protein
VGAVTIPDRCVLDIKVGGCQIKKASHCHTINQHQLLIQAHSQKSHPSPYTLPTHQHASIHHRCLAHRKSCRRSARSDTARLHWTLHKGPMWNRRQGLLGRATLRPMATHGSGAKEGMHLQQRLEQNNMGERRVCLYAYNIATNVD